MSKKKGDQEPGFEEALEAVERIISQIESGEIGLEQSLAEYERGVLLIRKCRETLERAEQRVRDLTGRMKAEGAAGGAASSSPPAPGDEEECEEDEGDSPF